MNILLIVASGKSSRFGGFPKAFCQLGNKLNAENTIQVASKYYDKVYIGVNKTTYQNFRDKLSCGELFYISTGQGDAHSLLKCIAHVKECEPEMTKITVCWGDAVFIDDTPFREILQYSDSAPVVVACANDPKPYAWFETTPEHQIVKAHFAKEEGFIPQGMHDQSLFLFDVDFAWKYLNEYRESLNIPYHNDENTADVNEMKLLFSFDYLYNTGNSPALCAEITPEKVLSFNTLDELNQIREKNNL